MVMEAAPETNRPYAPPSNVAAVLSRLRSRNLPEHIDAEYLRDAGVSEGTIGRTLFAMRFLDLIDEFGNPSQALRAMHTSTDEEYRTILSGLIREAFVEVFNVVNPAEDSQDRILNVFRRYTPASQRSRMVIFFLGMCREAGISTLDVPRQRSMREPRAPTSRSTTTQRRTPPTPPRFPPPGGTEAHPALSGLIQSLPAPGQPLSEERREHWLAMARATLAFVYPETESPVAVEEEGADLS